MTVSRTILTRGYFPKEMPPAFFTERFAHYAATAAGRATILAYNPTDNFTECVKYRLARSGSDSRSLQLPHPVSFARLTALIAKHFGRLLKKASRSKFARSRPHYVTDRDRAIEPAFKPSNLAREKAAIRAGSSFLLQADVSQFYPTLYTHAVGWAVDPQLRARKNWRNGNFLGKTIDQALMDSDGKLSQGIPIGTDISFLLSEVVLAQVDRATGFPKEKSYRWFDDYEIAFDTREQAENGLKILRREFDKFRLRLNPAKTRIIKLPKPTEDDWRSVVYETARVKFDRPHDMVRYFDTAFRLREQFPEAPIFAYALGVLFKVTRPADEAGKIAQSCITQAILSEPGATQKAFALLSYWRLNGFQFNSDLLKDTISKVILQHQSAGPSSDISWALAFCLQEMISLGSKVAQVLSGFDDDSIILQALNMNTKGLLPVGYNLARVKRTLKDADLDRDHWLVVYESVRHSFLPTFVPVVQSNTFFSQLLAKEVTFYRTQLPRYALVIHPGGAPEWVVKKWLTRQAQAERPDETERSPAESAAVAQLIESDVANLSPASPGLVAAASPQDVVSRLLNLFEHEDETEEQQDQDEYFS
jgi:hypothetical protein